MMRQVRFHRQIRNHIWKKRMNTDIITVIPIDIAIIRTDTIVTGITITVRLTAEAINEAIKIINLRHFLNEIKMQ
jgi:hypothetical protein